MGKVRFSVSVDEELVRLFEDWLKKKGYSNRSEAFRDVLRSVLVEDEWEEENKKVAAVVVLVYDHHTRGLTESLMDKEHEHHDVVIARTHAHLDEHNCLEVVLLKGEAGKLRRLGESLLTRKGVKFGRFIKATYGRGL